MTIQVRCSTSCKQLEISSIVISALIKQPKDTVNRERSKSLHAPTFIGIGPGKCGTTWLYNACANHPEVCVSNAKETLFFEQYFHKGMDWYLKFFKTCKCEGKKHAVGEVSNTYVFSPVAAQRIAETLPNVKLIFSLRNPIDRAFSHYLFMRRNGEVAGTFEEATKSRPDLALLSRGLYAQHLKPYFELFPREQLLGLLFDDLCNDPATYAHKVFSFLEVDPNAYQGDASEQVLGASAARSVLLSRIVVGAAAITRKLGYPNIVSSVKHSSISKLVFRPFAAGEKPKLSPETREKLKPFYMADLEKLSEMLDRDLIQHWGFATNASGTVSQ